MLDHYIQRDIVYRLAFTPKLRFSELKPDVLDNKLFTYHLKKVVAAGYVAKNENTYELTAEGRRLGIRVLDNQKSFINMADSVLILVIRRKSDGAWLLYRRNTFPLIDKAGFMHSNPVANQSVLATAQKDCLQKTGLDCRFKVLGSGYFRAYQGDDIESFIHFDLLVCDDANGQLKANDEFADYYWQQKPDFVSPDMLPNTQVLSELYVANKPFFIEKTFNLT
ncbi:MAG: hypothetical protein ABIQ89_02310 [Candidatus Saccharimonadales bacterium]